MSIIKLDGRELTVNLNAFSIKEYRNMVEDGITLEERAHRENTVIAKSIGMDVEEFENLPFHDWQIISRRFYEIVRQPDDSPNSESASTST